MSNDSLIEKLPSPNEIDVVPIEGERLSINRVHITIHALERFIERSRRAYGIKEVPSAHEKLQDLLRRAKERHRRVRFIDGEFYVVRFFHYQDWKFVVIEENEAQIVITSQNRRLRKPPPRHPSPYHLARYRRAQRESA